MKKIIEKLKFFQSHFFDFRFRFDFDFGFRFCLHCPSLPMIGRCFFCILHHFLRFHLLGGHGTWFWEWQENTLTSPFMKRKQNQKSWGKKN